MWISKKKYKNIITRISFLDSRILENNTERIDIENKILDELDELNKLIIDFNLLLNRLNVKVKVTPKKLIEEKREII